MPLARCLTRWEINVRPLKFSVISINYVIYVRCVIGVLPQCWNLSTYLNWIVSESNYLYNI